ncbi:MAG: hypothetical protein GY898_32890 [Proteobacteria bacterium]|nr:hypothetical protein [Pseudomonadota bacterium]
MTIKLRWCLLVLLGLALSACGGLDDDDTGPPVDDDLECGNAPAWHFALEGEGCPAGPSDCAEGLACINDVCTASCSDADDCLDTLGCADGTCGDCSVDAHCRDGESCRSGFCMPTEVPIWDLTTTEADWEAVHDDPFHDFWYDCVLTAGGVEYADGCQYRSYGSTARTYPKLSLRIRFPEDFEHPGYSRKITLRAEYNDPTMMRNRLGYETFRHLVRLPAPRTRYVLLRVNGEVYGLYVELERPAGKWLKRNDRDRDNSMYEAEHSPPQGGLMPMEDPAWYDVWDDDVMYNQNAGGPGDHSDIQALIEDVLWQDFLDSPSRSDTVLTRTGGRVDVNTHASYMAVHAIIQNRDHITANYNISWQHNSQGDPVWEVYPLDLDTTFGCTYDPEAGNNLCWDMSSDVWWLSGVAPLEGDVGYPNYQWMNMLAHLTLNNEQCGTAFNTRICNYLASDWWNDGIPRFVEATAETIRPALAQDPNDLINDPTMDNFDHAADEIVQFLSDRRAYLESNLLCP